MKLVKSANGKNGNTLASALPNLWRSFFTSPFEMPAFPAAFQDRPRILAPVIDIAEDDKEVTVKAEVAGLSEKDLELSYLDGVLYIKGEKKEEKEEKSRKNTWYKESWHGSFTRGVPVGKNVEWEKAHAKYKDGVIQVRIPKIKGAGKPNTIAIE